MHKDLYNSTSPVVAVPSAAVSSDTGLVGVILDTQGYESAIVNTFIGAWTAGDVIASVTESDDAGMSGAVAIAGDFLIGAPTAIGSANAMDTFGIVCTKRYIQVTMTSDNSANIASAGVNVVFGNAVVAGK